MGFLLTQDTLVEHDSLQDFVVPYVVHSLRLVLCGTGSQAGCSDTKCLTCDNLIQSTLHHESQCMSVGTDVCISM